MAVTTGKLGNIEPSQVHTGERCGTTWALCRPVESARMPTIELDGQLSRTVRVGDHVSVCDGSTDVQIASPRGGFLIIRDGVLIEWADTASVDLVCLNNVGDPAGLGALETATTSRGLSGDAIAEHLSSVPCGGGTKIELEHILRASRMQRNIAVATGRPHNCPICKRITAERAWANQGGTGDVPPTMLIA